MVCVMHRQTCDKVNIIKLQLKILGVECMGVYCTVLSIFLHVWNIL